MSKMYVISNTFSLISVDAHHSVSLPMYDDIHIQVLVSLSQSYPAFSAPQLQLLSKYIGAFSVDRELFGSVLKTFISQMSGVEFTPDSVAVFDGLQHVLELCSVWYGLRLSEGTAGDLVREEERSHRVTGNSDVHQSNAPAVEKSAHLPAAIPEGVELIEAEPITDRKSVFIGRACRITHPSQVRILFMCGSVASPDRVPVIGSSHFIVSDDGQTYRSSSTPNNQCMAM